MAENGYELLAQLGKTLFAFKKLFRRLEAVVRIEVVANQFGKQLECADDLRIVDLCRIGINSAERPKKLAIGQNDRHGDIAAQTVDPRRMVVAIERFFGGIIEDDRLTMPANFVAERAFNR